MEINESKEKSLHLIDEGIRTSEKGIRLATQNLNTLNMGNDTEDETGEEDSTGCDPTRFMSKQEIKEWTRLSSQSKEQFLKEGEREAAYSAKRKGKGRTTSEKFQLHYTELNEQVQAVENASAVSRTQNKYKGKRTDPIQSNGQTPKHINMTSVRGNKIAEIGMQKVGNSAATSTIAQAGKSAAQIGKAASTGGVTLAIEAGKKTAGAFRESLEARAMATAQTMQKSQQQLQQIKDSNQGMGTLPAAIKYTGAATAAAALSVAAVVVQIVASLLITLASVLAIVVFTILSAVIIVSIVMALIIAISSIQPERAAGAQQIVEVALAEEGTTDGSKYWEFTMGSHFSDGSSTPWCACFVSWCANECGLIDQGIFPNSAAVATYREFFRAKEQLHEERSYIPKTGDLILFGSNDHIGIVQYTEGGRVITIEGNTSDAVHSRSYSLDSDYITGYCTPEYPAGIEIIIPEGMGIYHTYMGWQSITSPTSLQYQLREESGEHYDSEGFARIGDRYVIACTTTFGGVGDYIDFYREDGTIVKAVIGDIKNQNDQGCNQYGHANGECVVEYVVQQSMWYPSHPNPGTTGCHPEWNSRIIKAVKLGRNYLD